jgi:hypothetical protein
MMNLTKEHFENAVIAHRANAPTTRVVREAPFFEPRTMRPGLILAALAGGSTSFEITAPVPRSMVLVRAPKPAVEEFREALPCALHYDSRGPRLEHSDPGLYIVRHDLGGGYSADYAIAAIPHAAYRMLGPWDGYVDHAAVMQSILASTLATIENAAAALETEGAGFPQLHGPDTGIDFRAHGGA